MQIVGKLSTGDRWWIFIANVDVKSKLLLPFDVESSRNTWGFWCHCLTVKWVKGDSCRINSHFHPVFTVKGTTFIFLYLAKKLSFPDRSEYLQPCFLVNVYPFILYFFHLFLESLCGVIAWVMLSGSQWNFWSTGRGPVSLGIYWVRLAYLVVQPVLLLFDIFLYPLLQPEDQLSVISNCNLLHVFDRKH